MNVEKLEDGLWRWASRHPHWTPSADSPTGWPADVGSMYFEPDTGGIVLVDPLIPIDEAEARRFHEALDADVARIGGRVVIVLMNAWHGRSARELRERHRAEVLCHEDTAPEVQAELTGTFAGLTAELPGGLVAHRVPECDGGEIVLELPVGRGLVFADAVTGIGGGRVRTCPSGWAPERDRDTFQQRLRARLRPLLDRPFGRLLPAHGEPVLEGARKAFEDALVAPPKGG